MKRVELFFIWEYNQINKFENKEMVYMRKFSSLILILICVLGIVGCGNNEKQDALMAYSNDILSELQPIEDAFNESYKSVTGENYNDDETTYNELKKNTIVLARELSDGALVACDEITDEEILEVHRIYVNYAANQLNAINLMITAIENEDRAMVSTANEKLNEANNYALDYMTKIQALTEKYDLELLD